MKGNDSSRRRVIQRASFHRPATLKCSDVTRLVQPPCLMSDHHIVGEHDTAITCWDGADSWEQVAKTFHREYLKGRRWTRTASGGCRRVFPVFGPCAMTIDDKNHVVLRAVMVDEGWRNLGKIQQKSPVNAGPEWTGSRGGRSTLFTRAAH